MPTDRMLEGVALDPSGSGRAIAVGNGGTIAVLDRGVGWNPIESPTDQPLHGIAWVAPTNAWAVGDGGTVVHWDGHDWAVQPVPSGVGGRDLTSVAFLDEHRGWAVGEEGLILGYEDGEWAIEREPAELAPLLNDVDVAAVGDDATARFTDVSSYGQQTDIASSRWCGHMIPSQHDERGRDDPGRTHPRAERRRTGAAPPAARAA